MGSHAVAITADALLRIAPPPFSWSSCQKTIGMNRFVRPM